MHRVGEIDVAIPAEFRLPPRAIDAHKGDCGRILIVAGSRGMMGAAILAARACLRSGAGLVTVATPQSLAPWIVSSLPTAMTLPLPETARGLLALESKTVLEPLLPRLDAVAIGPGLGVSAGVVAVVDWLIDTCPCPLILDADALNATAVALTDGRLRRRFQAIQDGDGVSSRPKPPSQVRVLTPHPGEFIRLWKGWRAGIHGSPLRMEEHEFPVLNTGDVSAERQQMEREATFFAQAFGGWVVLKGAGTLVTDGRNSCRNETGNPGMATAGSGDCLTGILAAQLAQEQNVARAIARSCWVHGKAGDLAAETLGMQALTATDLIDYLPQAWKVLED